MKIKFVNKIIIFIQYFFFISVLNTIGHLPVCGGASVGWTGVSENPNKFGIL